MPRLQGWLSVRARQAVRDLGLRQTLLPLWSSYRALTWRLRKLLGMPVRFPAGAGRGMLHPAGQIPHLLWSYDFEELERDFVQSYVKPGMQVLNIGANVGLYTVLASKLAGSAGKIHAFEPSSPTFGMLERNIALNRCGNVAARQLAISDVPGHVVLCDDRVDPTLDGHRFVERNAKLATGGETVEAVTIDYYLANLTSGSRTVDLVIMDIEGAELFALQGGSQMLTQNNLTLLMECSKNQKEVEVLLRSHGYSFWIWDSAARLLVAVDFSAAAALGDVIVRREKWSAEA
jgi:FkbM family methyltransferase